jgi:hypothetical protein
LIDTGKDAQGMRVIADLHGGDPNHPKAMAEFEEIKDKVTEEVRFSRITRCFLFNIPQRDLGEGRSYQTMWKKYKRRVLLAMSSQTFAQLVSSFLRFCERCSRLFRTG